MIRKSYNVLGVCAGQGVCLYPFEIQEGFRIIANIEPRRVFYDKEGIQWDLNFRKNQSLMIDSELNIKSRVDVIIGHPDCGDSSILRMSRAKKKGDTKSNKSIDLYLKSITKYQPKFWLLENLPGFLDNFPIEDLENLFPEYYIKHWVKSVSSWGNSQESRKRLVIVGVRKNLSKDVMKLFKLPKSVMISDSQHFELGVEEDPAICHVREPLTKTCNLYYGDRRQITYQEARDIWNGEFAGQSKWAVGGKMKNQPGVSRNLPDRKPFTVRKQNRQFGTTGLVLSPREMANIQGVPKSFKLHFEEGQRIYWINKSRLAVTKTMPFEIADWFMRKVLRAKQLINDTKSQ